MKKSLALLLVLALVFGLAACGSDPEPETTAPQNAAPAETTVPVGTTVPGESAGSTEIDTDEHLFTVEITLPASMIDADGDLSDFNVDAYVEENGFLGATINEDGSLTVTMTKAQHEETLREMAADLEASFAEFVEAEDTPYIKEIVHNDNFSAITIRVDRAAYENSWDFTAFAVGISAMFYQAFLDMECHVEVSVVDANTGDVINTSVYPDVIEGE